MKEISIHFFILQLTFLYNHDILILVFFTVDISRPNLPPYLKRILKAYFLKKQYFGFGLLGVFILLFLLMVRLF